MKYASHRIAAAGLAGLMLLSCLSGCGAAAESRETTAPAEAVQITEAANALLRSHSGAEGREETVYVIADASGNPTETIASVWLKNPEGAATLTDRAELSDIRNVKGSETYTAHPGGEIVWAADGHDIYYQGTTDKELPITTSISYTLDGKRVTAGELAGASGHLAITFSYTNNTATQRVVNGKTVTLYQPFLVVSGLVLDNAKAADVTVTRGRLINTGDQTIAVGMAMPGLSESLGLRTLKDADGKAVDIDLPESVTIEADVADFSLLTTVTVIENSLLQELKLEDVETVDDLRHAIDSLTDASTRLVSGSGEMYDGVNKLSGGARDLSAGAAAVDSGAGELSDGAATLADGARQLSDGASALSSGAAALSQGAASLSDNMGGLSSGLDALSGGAGALSAGLGQMQTQVADLPDGVDALYNGTLLLSGALKGSQGQSIYEGLQAIQNGAGAISAGLVSESAAAPGIYEAALSVRAGAADIAEGAGQISAAAEALLAELTAAQAELGGLLSQLEAVKDAIGEERYAAIQSMASRYLGKVDAAIGALTQIRDGAAGIRAGAQSGSTENPGIYEAASAIAAGARQLSQGAGSIASGAAALETGIDAIVSDKNLGAITNGLAAMSESSQALVDGVDQLAAGAQALTSGAASAAAGAEQLTEGAGQLAAGASNAAQGAAALSSGAASAADGASRLADGASALRDGTAQFREGSKALTDGVAQLLSGAQELMDGMTKFDADGIRKLANLLEDDAQGFLDRLRAVQALGQEYTSFSGSGEETPSSVRFIIRTGSIEE